MELGPADTPGVDGALVATGDAETRLQATIRQSIAAEIGVLLERDVFLRHLVDLVAKVIGRSMVAIYMRSGARGGCVLSGRTSAVPEHLPVRLPVAPDDVEALHETLEIPDFTGMRRLQRVCVPIVYDTTVTGYLAMLAEEPSVAAREVARLRVVADELAAALNVAVQHHTVQQACVVDLETGAYTFDFFQQRLAEELARSRRTSHAVTIVLVEPVDFEDFERTAGYERGDQVLRELADDFAAVTRGYDVVARRGRTGYAVLLPESGTKGAQIAIARIRRRLTRQSELLAEDGLSATAPRFAIGTASAPDDGNDPTTLMLIAEQRQFEDEAAPALAHAS